MKILQGMWMLLSAMLLVSAATAGGCTKVNDTSVEDVVIQSGELRTLIAEQAKKPNEPVLLLMDARLPGAFKAGALPGARNYDLALIDDRPGAIDPAIERYASKVVYGGDPADGAARALAKKLLGAGYGNVRWFSGGWSEWNRTLGGASAR